MRKRYVALMATAIVVSYSLTANPALAAPQKVAIEVIERDSGSFDSKKKIKYQVKTNEAWEVLATVRKFNFVNAVRVSFFIRNKGLNDAALAPVFTLVDGDGLSYQAMEREALLEIARSAEQIDIPEPKKVSSSDGNGFADGFASGFQQGAANAERYAALQEAARGRDLSRWTSTFLSRFPARVPAGGRIAGNLIFSGPMPAVLPLKLKVELGSDVFEFNFDK